MVRSDFRARYGPWALIAGASEGLGAEFATQLAALGFNLVLVARRKSLLDELSARLEQTYTVGVRVLVLDLAEEEAVHRIVEATQDLEIGLLIHNAAVAMIGPYFETSLENHRREIIVNCHNPMTLAYLFGKSMIERQRGGIILMSSMSASQGTPLVANYGATKAYNQVLAEGLWDELRTLGVDILASLPAPIKTPRYLASAPHGSVSALSPQLVVSDALAALGKRPTTVPSLTYRLASIVMQRLLPRKTAIRIMGRATRGMYGNKYKGLSPM